MENKQNNNPLHGLTLEKIMTDLQGKYGWQRLGEEIRIKCFNENPSLKSSLIFLRRTPWARAKVEKLYLASLKGDADDKPRALSMRPKNNSSRRKDENELWLDMKL